jgi:hypothetical protein
MFHVKHFPRERSPNVSRETLAALPCPALELSTAAD